MNKYRTKGDKIMSKMFRIGEISKIFDIPQQTLRYYDKIGLFSPAYINPETGYRYYTLIQLQQLLHIKTLKNINLSISDIKDFGNSNWNLDDLETLLSKQVDYISRSIEELNKLKNGIQSRMEFYRNLKTQPKNEIVTHEVNERVLYSKPIDIHSNINQEMEYYRSFVSLSNPIDYININPGFIVSKSDFFKENFIASHIILDTSNNLDESNFIEGYKINRLSKGMYCSLFIEDSYSNSEKYYKIFKDFIIKNNITLLSDVYELCYTVMTDYKEESSSWEITARINA